MNLTHSSLIYLKLGNLLLGLFAFSIDEEINTVRKLNQTCIYHEADVQYEKGKEGPSHTPFCEINGKMLEIIGIHNIKKERLISGTSCLTIPEIIIESNKLYIPDGSTDVLIDNSRYKIASHVTGTKDVLVIRVIARDASSSIPSSTLSDNIFGTNGDSFNMRSQFKACSRNKLIMRPFSGNTKTGRSIKNGVGEVEINIKVTGVDKYTVMDKVLDAVIKKYGDVSSQFDHLMLCLPPGTADDWIGFGYYNSYLTIFNDNWCDKPSLNMHEIGHNFDQMHSSELDNEYGDQSCLMGYSYYDDYGPAMCFNGAKSWSLGWYSKGHVTINTYLTSYPSFSGTLIGVNNYKKRIGKKKTIIKVIGTGSKDYYIMFNLAKGINSGVYEGRNQVTIVSRSSGSERDYSYLETMLGSGGKYFIPGTGYYVEVVNISLKAKLPSAEVIVKKK